MSSTATATVIRTEARLFGRELGSLFWIIGFPTLMLVILGAIPFFREPDEALGGLRTIDLYAAVSVLLAMIMASLMAMPAVLSNYRERGILRRLRTTPVHPSSLLAAQVGLHGGAVLAGIVLVLATARVIYHVPLPGALGWYALSLLLALIVTLSIGAVLTAVAPTSRSLQILGSIVFFPMMFTAGIWMPVQAMPDWLREIVVLTPLGAASEALNSSLLGQAPHLVDLAVMIGWTVVLSLIAVRTFRWE